MRSKDLSSKTINSKLVSTILPWLSNNLALVIFFVALSVRLVAILWWNNSTDTLVVAFGNRGIDSPSGEFSDLARNILSGKGFSFFEIKGTLVPSAYMPPPYAYFLAGIFLFFGDNAFGYVIVQIINAILGAFLCLVVMRMGDILFNKETGVIAGLFTVFFPVFIFMTTRADVANIYVLLNCIVLYLFLSNNLLERKIRISLIAGILYGFLILFRPETLAYVLVLLLWLIFTSTTIKAGFKDAALLIICVLLVLTPWTVRNYTVFNKIIPVTSLGGFNLWRGQNDMTTGSGRGQGSEWSTPKIHSQIEMLPPTNDWEIRRDKIYRDEALRFITENPQRSLSLIPRKLFYYWVLNTGDVRTHAPIYWLPYFLLIPFFLLGLIKSRQYGTKPWLLLGYLLMASILTSVFFVLSRYRLFTDPVVLLLSALGLYEVYQKMKCKLFPSIK